MATARPKIKHQGQTASLAEWLLYSLLFAGLIVVCSEIGRLLGTPGTGLKISGFWPAAGVALSALLLFGIRLLPGIFLGALAYNIYHLAPAAHTLLENIVMGTIFSLGSTLQATLAYYIIMRYASVDFFNRFRDTLIFLLPAGILTCVVASGVSVGSLILGGYLPLTQGLNAWLTFWIGDTMGVYLITPLIIAFFMADSTEYTPRIYFECSLLLVLIVGASIVIFFSDYPVYHLILPLILWGALRFNIRGATICLLIVSTIAIFATATGHGPFVKFDTKESLLFLVTALMIASSTTLILVSVLNEREKNAQLLRAYSNNLEDLVEQRTKQLQETQATLKTKEKLASMGILASGISFEIRHPLAYIRDLAKTGEEYTLRLKEDLNTQAPALSEEAKKLWQTQLSTIGECLQQIGQNEQQAKQIVDSILKFARRESSSLVDARPIRLHALLDNCCADAMREFDRADAFPVKIIKRYDTTINFINALGDDLIWVFSNLIGNALYALRQKMERHPSTTYEPTLTIKTKSYNHTIEISIKDNGIGMSEAVLRRAFQPFFSTKPLGEGTGLGLALSYDIIVQEHHGTIVAASLKEVFTEIVITLPKARQPEE